MNEIKPYHWKMLLKAIKRVKIRFYEHFIDIVKEKIKNEDSSCIASKQVNNDYVIRITTNLPVLSIMATRNFTFEIIEIANNKYREVTNFDFIVNDQTYCFHQELNYNHIRLHGREIKLGRKTVYIWKGVNLK